MSSFDFDTPEAFLEMMDDITIESSKIPEKVYYQEYNHRVNTKDDVRKGLERINRINNTKDLVSKKLDSVNTQIDTTVNILSLQDNVKNTKTENLPLLIITKMDTVLLSIYPSLRNFPKFERLGLSPKIRDTILSFNTYMHLANKVASRRMQYAQEADGFLMVLKNCLYLAHSQRYISTGFHWDLSKELTGISDMLTSYIKNIYKK